MYFSQSFIFKEESNSEYLYELSAMTESSTFVVGEAKVFVPLDLEVKNEMNLPDQNGTLNLGRLIMSKGSRLKTLGKNVKLIFSAQSLRVKTLRLLDAVP